MNDDQATAIEADAQGFLLDARQSFAAATVLSSACFAVGIAISWHLTKRSYQLALLKASEGNE